MATPDDIRRQRLVELIIRALEAITRGDAGAIEIVSSTQHRDAIARSIVDDYVVKFALDVVITELPYGFRVTRHGIRLGNADLDETAIRIAA